MSLGDIYNQSNDISKNENKVRQSRFQVKSTKMRKMSITKSYFSSLNDRRYHFPNGIVSLPFGHPFLENTRNIKKQFKRKIQKHIKQMKGKLLKEEHCVLAECERLCILSFILG